MKISILAVCGLLLMSGVCVKAAFENGIGGVFEAGVTDPAVVEAAKYVTASANSNHCNGLCASLKREGDLKLVEVVSAKTQVVAGTLYKMELLVEDQKGQKVRCDHCRRRAWNLGRFG
jgi:hypothetical protein